MGQLSTTPQRTEPITFNRVVKKSDGAGGYYGDAEPIKQCLAVVRPMKSTRLLEANQTTLRQGYTFDIWVDPNFEPKTGDTIQYRDEILTIQGYRYVDDTRKRYEITALEGNPNNAVRTTS